MLKKYIALLAVIIILTSSPVSYVLTIAADQIYLLSHSQKIETVLKDPQVDSAIKTQLALVPDIMQLGNNLGFPETKAYARYIPLQRNVFLHSLSATKQDSFEEYTWWWPFIGTLPYKGFINKTSAQREEAELKAKGYDTYLGKSSAMSTLGFFSDPILATMINTTDATVLMNTIYHERTHQLFFTNDIVFNENAAVLLGALAALEFTQQQFGNESAEHVLQQEKISDLLLFSQFIDNCYTELDTFYHTSTPPEKIEKRKNIFNLCKDNFNDIPLKRSFKSFGETELNNAYILAQYRYYGKIHEYYQVYEKIGDIRKTIEFFNQASQAENPDSVILS